MTSLTSLTCLTSPTRTRTSLLTTTILLACVGVATLACDSTPAETTPEPASRQAQRTTPSPAASPAASPAPSPAASPAASPAQAPVAAELPKIDDGPVLANTTATTTPTPASITTPSAPKSQIEIPEAHQLAFTQMPHAKSDKPPIAGIGATGIHLDELAVGKGWASSRCEALDARFQVETDERVNVCFRVVHPATEEVVTVEWARDGKVRQRIDLNIKASHAYLTRAWMPVTAGRAGAWTATVKSADGSELGAIEFEIAR